jgi:DDE superfamily endonuclease
LQNQGYFIVKGYTSKLKVLDVGVNQPLKHYVKQSYKNFMVKSNGRQSTWLDVVNWVLEAWSKVKKESITDTWASIIIGPYAGLNTVAGQIQ